MISMRVIPGENRQEVEVESMLLHQTELYEVAKKRVSRKEILNWPTVHAL